MRGVSSGYYGYLRGGRRSATTGYAGDKEYRTRRAVKAAPMRYGRKRVLPAWAVHCLLAAVRLVRSLPGTW